jgi:hypothetical protein
MAAADPVAAQEVAVGVGDQVLRAEREDLKAARS